MTFNNEMGARLWRLAIWVFIGFFIINLVGIIAAVVVDSFGTSWFNSWLPGGFTTSWYSQAWSSFQLGGVLLVTFEVAGAVLLGSALLGVPAAYALARRDFPGKRFVMLIFVLPLIIPPFTYGIPLASVLYKFGLGGTLTGVILANLMPSVPFVIFILVPFIEQIDPRVEAAARVFGAGTGALLRTVMVPLLVPGILAALLLVLVRTIGMFELTFLTAGPGSQTLVVELYYSVFAAGMRANQSIDAMAVIYMATSLICLVIALRFVDPTQIVGRAKRTAH
ncbi:ABC transporter permease [Acidocella sp.]|uniref:ABC transporter permease n=1 Tax=Acidocella sp. TaxID=50710 RepID=UPI001832DCE0|nr:ABC transporter permease subunit [Acidocella sp.]NNM56112.1 ABC transporter permease subunit [Acidocella sp.]